MGCELLHKVLQAHGGLDRWNSFQKVHATIVTGGQLFGMKGTPQAPTPRRMAVATRHEWASVTPYGADDQRTDFTANRIAIEKVDGTVVKERLRPSEHAEEKLSMLRGTLSIGRISTDMLFGPTSRLRSILRCPVSMWRRSLRRRPTGRVVERTAGDLPAGYRKP